MLFSLELPQETLYLIDKVVRQRSKLVPIGVDNSELINLEIEHEFKEKNKYIQNLVEGGKISQEDPNLSEDKENIENQRLMQRLTQAANNH